MKRKNKTSKSEQNYYDWVDSDSTLSAEGTLQLFEYMARVEKLTPEERAENRRKLKERVKSYGIEVCI